MCLESYFLRRIELCVRETGKVLLEMRTLECRLIGLRGGGGDYWWLRFSRLGEI